MYAIALLIDANRRKWLGDNPETTTNAVFVDEKWRPSYICWKSTTSLTNLDYFEVNHMSFSFSWLYPLETLE